MTERNQKNRIVLAMRSGIRLALAGLSASALACGGLVAPPGESDAGASGPSTGASTPVSVTPGANDGSSAGSGAAGTYTGASGTAAGAVTGTASGTAGPAVGSSGSIAGSSGSITGSTTGTGSSGILRTVDASTDGEANRSDAAPKDASSVSDAPQNDGAGMPTFCSVLDGLYGTLIHQVASDWPSEIINGPISGALADGGSDEAYNQYTIGVTQAGCAPNSVMYTVYDYVGYTNRMVAYQLRVFGCSDGVPYNPGLGGYEFAIVPTEYSAPLSTGDLDNLVAFYVQQAQLILQNHGTGVLTPAQVDQMTQLLTATEGTYPNILSTTHAPTVPTCREFDGGLQ
jgi:hypothetical protein